MNLKWTMWSTLILTKREHYGEISEILIKIHKCLHLRSDYFNKRKFTHMLHHGSNNPNESSQARS